MAPTPVRWLIEEGVEVDSVQPQGIVPADLVGRVVKASEAEVEAVVNRFPERWMDDDVHVDIQNADDVTDVHEKGEHDQSGNDR